MRTLWPQLVAWLDAGEPFALATVTATSGSAPRAPGACMAIMPERARFLGSVSSGCLDVEVVEAARVALRSGCGQRLRFGPDGQPPWIDGLTCGGWIDICVEPWWGNHPRDEVRAIAPRVRAWLEQDGAGIVLSNETQHCAIDDAGRVTGDSSAFAGDVIAQARAHLRDELPPMEWGSGANGARVFLRTVRRRPRLVVVGAVDVAAHLVACAHGAGFATCVIDPRAAYATIERFTRQPDELLRAWPQEVLSRRELGPRDVAVVLTHDPKIDDPALLALLSTCVGYIGALGSSRSHASRLDRLRSDVPDEIALARIHGPAGIHLGAPDAMGIAAGVFAGIVQWQAAADAERRRVAPLVPTASRQR